MPKHNVAIIIIAIVIVTGASLTVLSSNQDKTFKQIALTDSQSTSHIVSSSVVRSGVSNTVSSKSSSISSASIQSAATSSTSVSVNQSSLSNQSLPSSVEIPASSSQSYASNLVIVTSSAQPTPTLVPPTPVPTQVQTPTPIAVPTPTPIPTVFRNGGASVTVSYDAPGGIINSLQVQMDILNDTIVSVTTQGNASDSISRTYISNFIANYKPYVVNKPLAELSVPTRLAGASLTSASFNTAITAIQNQTRQ